MASQFKSRDDLVSKIPGLTLVKEDDIVCRIALDIFYISFGLLYIIFEISRI